MFVSGHDGYHLSDSLFVGIEGTGGNLMISPKDPGMSVQGFPLQSYDPGMGERDHSSDEFSGRLFYIILVSTSGKLVVWGPVVWDSRGTPK